MGQAVSAVSSRSRRRISQLDARGRISKLAQGRTQNPLAEFFFNRELILKTFKPQQAHRRRSLAASSRLFELADNTIALLISHRVLFPEILLLPEVTRSAIGRGRRSGVEGIAVVNQVLRKRDRRVVSRVAGLGSGRRSSAIGGLRQRARRACGQSHCAEKNKPSHQGHEKPPVKGGRCIPVSA